MLKWRDFGVKTPPKLGAKTHLRGSKPPRFVALAVTVGLITGLLAFPGGAQTPSFAAGDPKLCRSDGGGTTQETDAKKNGFYIQSGIRLEPIFAKKMYSDFRAGYDAMYIGYRITNNSGSAISNAWVTVDGWSASPQVKLARDRDRDQQLPTLAAGSSTTVYFLVKATGYSTQDQKHMVRIWADGDRSSEKLVCESVIEGVQRSIAARANKVTSITADPPVIGQDMEIRVTGLPGQVGQGQSPDGSVMTLSPTTYSHWPTASLKLTKITVVLKGFKNNKGRDDCSTAVGGVTGGGTNAVRTVTVTDRLIIRSLNSCLGAGTRLSYETVYTFDVVGKAATNPTIVPVSDISSGTQIKYTGGYPSETTEVSLTEATVSDEVANARVVKAFVDNADSPSRLDDDDDDGDRIKLTYTITASSTGDLSLDYLVDAAPDFAELLGTPQVSDATSTRSVAMDQ